MKNKIAIGVIFLITYVGFIIATLPTALVLNQFLLPNNMQISGVSGNIWRTKIAQVNIEEVSIKEVYTKLSFWSLFTLTPKLSITFGDSFIAGPEGEFTLLINSEKAEIKDLKLLIKANEIAQHLTLPLPLSAQGNVELTLLNAVIDLKNKNQCISIKGTASWSKAGVVALAQNIKLGNLTANISCKNSSLTVTVSPKNDLGLSFSAYIQQNGNISGNGFLKPGNKFPQALNDALPLLGNKDRQGRYRLSF